MGVLTALIAAAALGGLPEDAFLTGSDSWAGGAAALSCGGSEFLDFTPLGFLVNPALASSQAPGYRIEASGGMLVSFEKRTRTVYDSFGSSIGEAEHSFNSGADLVPGGIAVSASGTAWLPEGMSVAAGLRLPASFSYDYERIVRNEYYVVTGTDELSISGGVSEFCGAAAFTPAADVSFGLSGGLISGSRDSRWQQDRVDPSEDDVLLTESSELEGFIVRGSVSGCPDERVRLCLGAEKRMSMEWNGSTDGSLDLPILIRGAAGVLPGNRLQTRFSAEVRYSATSGAEFAGSDMGLRDSWRASAGIENTIPNGPICRFGFSYERSPLASSLDGMSITAGLGFRVADWRLDLGGSFSPRRWDQLSLPPLQSFDAGDSLTVEESGTVLVLSFGRAF